MHSTCSNSFHRIEIPCRTFLERVGSTNSIAWKRLLLWNKWLLQWSKKKNNNNLDDHNFVGEANWSGVLSFHFVNYATLTQTVYVLIFSPLHYTTHLRWTCQSSVINMILFFLRFWINMLLYVKESSLLGLFPVGTVRKSRSRKLSVVGLKGNGVVPDSLPTTKYQSYTDQRTVVKNTIFKSKMDYYSSLIYSAESDRKTLFRTITRLLHRKADKRFPTSSSAVDLANKFVHFFEEKIVNIRSNLGTPVIPDFFRTLNTSSLTCQLVNFAPTSNAELSNIANNIIL